MSEDFSFIANPAPPTASASDVLIPNKAALWRLGASRTHLWRVVKSKPENCPSPVIVRGRVFWRERDIEALRSILSQFEGRPSFEKEQQAERCFHKAEEEKRKLTVQRSPKKRRADKRQLDLFAAPQS